MGRPEVCFLLPVSTLNSQALSIREELCRATYEITAYDLPTFLWPTGVFELHDTYKGFLRSDLLVTVSFLKFACDFATLIIILRHTNMFLYPQVLRKKATGQHVVEMHPYTA